MKIHKKLNVKNVQTGACLLEYNLRLIVNNINLSNNIKENTLDSKVLYQIIY